MFSWLRRNRDAASGPNAASVMERCIILKYLFVKNLATPPLEDFSGIMSQWSSEERSQFAIDTAQMFTRDIDRLKAAGLWSNVEEDERRFLQSGIDQISPQQQVDASWLAESIACLLWALKILPELPPYDQEAGNEPVKMLPTISIKDLVKQARLRPQKEIKKQRGIAELWHWRARTRKLQEEGRLQGEFGGLTIERIIEISALKGAENGDLPRAIEADFPALKKAYRDLSSEEFAILTSIAQERHKAFNWLCGLSPSGRWSDTPTGT